METLEKIAEMAKEKSWQEITNKFILPKVLKPSGAARNYKISDEYMTVVAEFANLIRLKDRQTADLLLELAMQRISCGAVKHRSLDVANRVPPYYAYYSAFQDRPAIMSNACVDFLQRGLPYCFHSTAKLREHAEAILYGIIFNLDYKTGAPLNGFDLSQITISSNELRKWAWMTASSFLDFDKFWRKLVDDDWRKYKDFFIKSRDKIDVKELHRALYDRYPPQKIWRDLAVEDWNYHIGFFHDYWYALDKKEFFDIVGAKTLAQRIKIELKIKFYSA